jgi:polysaccharide export outer membrane protein
VLLPLVGTLAVAGRDFDEVRREVDARYAKELQHRSVRVTPLVRIAVLGEVRAPGLFPVDPSMRLGDVLALAGGLGPEANRDRIELVRDGGVIAVVSEPNVASLDRRLESGDQVVVARRGWIHSNAPTLIGGATSLVVAVLTTLLLR